MSFKKALPHVLELFSHLKKSEVCGLPTLYDFIISK